MKIIDLYGICKYYHNNKVLHEINYSFEKGKVYLLIGENGSGKTTFVKGLAGLIYFSKGEIEKGQIKISYVPEKINFPDYLSVYDLLYNFGKIKKMERNQLIIEIEKQLAFWQLPKNRLLKDLSKGMYQKVLLIQSLLGESDLYIFDEALNGLDFKMQDQFLMILKDLKRKMKTLIISSHYPKYFKEITDKYIYLKDGKLYDQSD